MMVQTLIACDESTSVKPAKPPNRQRTQMHDDAPVGMTAASKVALLATSLGMRPIICEPSNLTPGRACAYQPITDQRRGAMAALSAAMS